MLVEEYGRCVMLFPPPEPVFYTKAESAAVSWYFNLLPQQQATSRFTAHSTLIATVCMNTAFTERHVHQPGWTRTVVIHLH